MTVGFAGTPWHFKFYSNKDKNILLFIQNIYSFLIGWGPLVNSPWPGRQRPTIFLAVLWRHVSSYNFLGCTLTSQRVCWAGKWLQTQEGFPLWLKKIFFSFAKNCLFTFKMNFCRYIFLRCLLPDSLQLVNTILRDNSLKKNQFNVFLLYISNE